MINLDTFKHLLPRGRAWKITVEKTLRRFFDGLAAGLDDPRLFVDNIWADLFPSSTRQLVEWELQFDLRDTGLTEVQRRARLDAAWKGPGGQDPSYIQNTLQINGFDVFVHEWWVPGTEAAVGVKSCTTPIDPFLYLQPTNTSVVGGPRCGEALAQCGEATALCGNQTTPLGYPLVNKVLVTSTTWLALCGMAGAQCGEADIECGSFSGFSDSIKTYTIPLDPDKWSYFLYIGGEVFGETAVVDPKRRDEFERLCLRISPNQLWLGMLVQYY